jgi:hypothetical protein
MAWYLVKYRDSFTFTSVRRNLQEVHRKCALVNTVMNLRVPEKGGEFTD